MVKGTGLTEAQTKLASLIERTVTADGPDRHFDYEIFTAFVAKPGQANAWDPETGHLYTSSVDAALSLIEQTLPGFWVSSGLCALTGHASMGPDYNGPHGDELRQTWPEAQFHDAFHADLAPGDGIHRQCYAILHCFLQARAALAERGGAE